MSDELKYKLFSPTDCLSEQTMFDYIDHKLSPKEQHRVELHLLSCELCSDAMEGLRMVQNRKLIRSINEEVSERMALPVVTMKGRRAGYRTLISIAAGLLLLAGGVFFFSHLSPDISREKTVAELKKPAGHAKADSSIAGKGIDIPEADSAAVATKSAEKETTPAQMTEELQQPEEAAENKSYNYATNDGAAAGTPAPEPKTIVMDETIAADAPADQERSAMDPVAGSDYKKLEESKNADRASVEFKANKQDANGVNRKEAEAGKKLITEQLNTVPGVMGNSQTLSAGETTGSGDTFGWSYDADTAKQKDKNPALRDAPQPVATYRVQANTDSVSSALAGISISRGSEDAPEAAQEIKKIPGVKQQGDTKAQYPGGTAALLKFIHTNAKWPEPDAKDTISSTKIVIRFRVNANGTLTDPKIIKGINPGYDKEALRLVSLMPSWIPAQKNGKNVSSLYTLPLQVEIR